MPQRYFYLDDEQQQCLTASWKYNWKYFTLSFQGQKISSFDTKEELAEGQEYVMPDGRLLAVRLSCARQPELIILLNGVLLHGSDTDPLLQIKHNYHLAGLLGILCTVGGLAAVFLQSEWLLNLGFGYESAIVGLAYLLLSWGIKRLSLVAVYAMIALIALDVVLVFSIAVLEGGIESALLSGLLLKLFFIYSFMKGIGAITKLKQKKPAPAVMQHSSVI